ncbi:hypothetical protein HPB50_011776 [Hyalomma asiaticum]|uniref:Uncharacterized protein n=1 Tax=Hyalomma asiaticum TaxID=266040 RepID=A0ACB7S7Z4_HYAAI|nr:hypothetical protein HPB50_011776 [Hyalomma asiaticum]
MLKERERHASAHSCHAVIEEKFKRAVILHAQGVSEASARVFNRYVVWMVPSIKLGGQLMRLKDSFEGSSCAIFGSVCPGYAGKPRAKFMFLKAYSYPTTSFKSWN